MRTLILMLTLALLGLNSCKKSEGDPPTGPSETLPENVIGAVTDLNGAPLANVQMHIVYSVNAAPASPLDEIQNPTITVFYTTQVLTTEFDGDVPLAEGTNIIVMWDADNDGEPSSGDRQPTMCATPPDCGFQTVNFNQFAMNGVALGIGAGTFGTDPAFSTYFEHLEPSRYYLEIRCTDGNALWRSNVVEPPDGLSEFDLVFTWAQCEGTPVGETTLDFCYPNPALDNVTMPFTLRAASNVTIAVRSLSTNISTTLLQGVLEQGTQDRSLDISGLPNGVYVYSLIADNFAGQDTLLKNVTGDALRGTPALTTSDGDGEFAMNAPFGATITLREPSSNPLGESLPLDSVRVVAILNGYLPSDTTIALSAAEQHELSLRLRPE